jgi:CRP-like cAMP-binding protein
MSLAEELVAVKALRGLGEAHLQKLAAMAAPGECAAGEVLFREVDVATSVFILLSGEINLEVTMPDRGATVIYVAGPGELLGWSPVLGRRSMTATAMATTPCRLAVLEVARMNQLLEEDLHFAVAFLRQLAIIVSDRLRATRQCLASVRGHFQSPRFGDLREGSD